MANEKLNIIVIHAGMTNTVSRVIEEISNAGHTPVEMFHGDVYGEISESNGYDKLHEKTVDSEGRIYSRNIHRIIPRFGGSSHATNLYYHLFYNLKKFGPFRPEAKDLVANKWRTACRLSLSKIQTVQTILTHKMNGENFDYLLNVLKGLPCFAKFNSGSQGKGVIYLESTEGAITALESISPYQENLLLQRKIKVKEDNEHKVWDIRAIVVDGRVVCSMKRKSKAYQLRANVSISNEGEPYELTEDQKELVLNAATVCGLIGFAGVDLLQDEHGKNYILEVNSNPGVKIEKICNYNYSRDLVDFIVRGSMSKEAKSRSANFPAAPQIVGDVFTASRLFGFSVHTRVDD